VQAVSSSHSHPLIIIIRCPVQAHAWMVVEKEWGAAVARLICQMIHDSKLRDCQVTYCPLQIRNWRAALNRSAIEYEGRIPLRSL